MELHDPLTYPQVIAFQQAINEATKLREEQDNLSVQQLHFALLPAIIDCVKKWDLENLPKKLTTENFPATPAIASAELMNWLQTEITVLIVGAETVPNE